MKNSIKRGQSQAGLSFAERKNFRPKVKRTRLLLLLVLLMTAATGAWGMQIYISYPSWPTGTNVNGDGNLVLEMEASDSFENMKAKIQDKSGLNPDYMKLYFNSVEMANDETLYAKGVTLNSVLTLVYTPYNVTMKEGTEDADKWTVKVGEATTFSALPLEGVAEGQTVTLKYSGTREVKSITAKVEVIPDGAIKGKFTINADGKQVYFSKGNLQAVCTSADDNPSYPETFTWQFAENQWDCVGNNAANYSIDGNGSVSAAGTVDLFGWSTAATTYGIHNSTTASDYSGDFVDWGGIIGTGWRTLTKDEWNYLFMTRESGSKVNGMSPSPDNARYTHATINTDNETGGIRGMILFPDGVTVNYSDATSWGGINQYSNWNGSTKCTTSQWNALAAKGFVFLPTGGVRNGTTISNSNNNGYYWSSYTASPTSGYAHYTRVVASNEPTTDSDSRKIGISVRLVYDVE